MSSRPHADTEAVTVDSDVYHPATDWADVAASYPSTEYMDELSRAVTRAVEPRRGDDAANAAQRWKGDLTRRISHLSPVLNEWFGKKQYWYAADIMKAVTNVADTKRAAIEHLMSTNDGANFRRGTELASYEAAHEHRIDALLARD